MSLLPSSRSESEAAQEDSLRILDVDDDEADAVFDALSSKTTRIILAELHRTPRTPAELAEQTDTTVQNAMYHLEKLEAVDLAQVTETQYSSRGKEMCVYAPSAHPAVVFIGTDDRKASLIARIKQFLGAIGVLTLLVYVIDLLRAVGHSIGSHIVNPRTTLVAVTTTFLTLVITSSTADDATRKNIIPNLNSMQRRTLILTLVLLAGICAVPAAIAHGSNSTGEYTTSTAPASITGSPAKAGVPDVANESVTTVVTGGNSDVQAAVSKQLEQQLEDRGGTVEHTDRIQNVSRNLFVVQIDENTLDPGQSRLTPRANMTVYFTYVASGNATVAESALSQQRTHSSIRPTFQTERQAIVGSFLFERGGNGIRDLLNMVERGGADAKSFRQGVGETVANTSVKHTFDKGFWT